MFCMFGPVVIAKLVITVQSCQQLKEFEDTKEVIRIRKSKKNRQHNDQEKKDKQWSTNHAHKTKDRVTQTPLKTGGLNSVAPEGLVVPARSIDLPKKHYKTPKNPKTPKNTS